MEKKVTCGSCAASVKSMLQTQEGVGKGDDLTGF